MEYTEVVEFADALAKAINEKKHKGYYIECTKGQKYVKYVIHNTSNNHGSVLAFVELSSGDIIKPASFQQPQKEKGGLAVRGNISTPAGRKIVLDAADPFGGFLYKDRM